jgi:hypothetical protein
MLYRISLQQQQGHISLIKKNALRIAFTKATTTTEDG